MQQEGNGTHFIISPVSEMLVSDIEEDITTLKKGEATNLQRHLLGFSNTMQQEDDIPIKTAFRDHKDNNVVSLVGPDEFFTPEDYEIADHHIQGEFDSYGNFKGSLDVYHQGPKEIEFNFNLSGQKSACGSFNIKFAYIQGRKKESQVPFDLYTALKNKLDSFGGIYVYKNGIRVLPYGNSDYDFLEIERRRTLHAGMYFFSYRRMFGSINIDTQENKGLQEKAGREGFQANKAYRQFRDYLMQFFEELAAKHFTEDGVYAEEWLENKKALEKEHRAIEKRRKSVTAKKRRFKQELENLFYKIESEEIQEQLEKIVLDAEDTLNSLVDEFEMDEIATRIIELEITTQEKLKKYYDSFVITKPRAVGLTKSLTRDWVAYQKVFKEKVIPFYQSAKDKLNLSIGDVSKKAKLHLDMRARLKASINLLRDYNYKQVTDQRLGTKKALESVDTYVNEQLKYARKEFDETKSKIEREIIEADFKGMNEEKFISFRNALETQLENNSTNLKNKLETIKNHLLNVKEDSDDPVLSNDVVISALETELETLKEDYAFSIEMAQMGMAVSVIHHEFEANIRGVRNSIKELQQWANKNDVLRELYTNMRNGFDHLDNYLSLFTPLDRRLRKRKTKITGEAVGDFIKDLFGERLKRHDVELKITESFKDQSLSTFASVIYPVFVNVIDNAIHWLSEKDGFRQIVLDATETGFSISDNGQGITARDQPHVFDFGFTRRLSGRGMGLYIAKTSLNKEGMDIHIEETYNTGAKFIIEPMED